MSGTLEINEDDVWMPAGWVFDNTLERVGNELLSHDRNLAEMFLQATTESSGGFLDLRSMGASEMKLTYEALLRVRDRTLADGPQAFHDPAFYVGYVTQLTTLIQMLERDRRVTDAR